MTTGRKNVVRRSIAWWLQGERMAELKAARWSRPQRRLLQEATSQMQIAWRVLAGLEPVPAATRSAVALPLISAGFDTFRRAAAPERATFVELFDEPEWQTRFGAAGLTAERLTAARAWLSMPAVVAEPAGTASKDALIALRAALESTYATERSLRRLRWRRLYLFAAVLAILAGGVAGVLMLVKPAGPPDLAAGRPWTSSSNYPGFSSAGSKPTRPIEGLFFSTAEEESPWWSVDLGSSQLLTSAEVENRSDCCVERAFPLALELSSDGKTWREVGRRTEPFSTWEPQFGPVKARYVRLRALKRTLLHFRDVRVHGIKK